MRYSGKIGEGKSAQEVIQMNVSSKTFSQGAVVELESNLVELWDGTGDIVGLADKTIASDTTTNVTLISRGARLTGKVKDLTAVEINDSGIYDDGNVIAFAGGDGLADNALIGAKLKVISCAATPSAVGQIYTVTDSESISGGYSYLIVTGNVTATFAAGDVVRFANLNDCKNTLVGNTGIELDSTGTMFDFANNFGQSDFTILDIVNDNEIVVVAVNTAF